MSTFLIFGEFTFGVKNGMRESRSSENIRSVNNI